MILTLFYLQKGEIIFDSIVRKPMGMLLILRAKTQFKGTIDVFSTHLSFTECRVQFTMLPFKSFVVSLSNWHKDLCCRDNEGKYDNSTLFMRNDIIFLIVEWDSKGTVVDRTCNVASLLLVLSMSVHLKSNIIETERIELARYSNKAYFAGEFFFVFLRN